MKKKGRFEQPRDPARQDREMAEAFDRATADLSHGRKQAKKTNQTGKQPAKKASTGKSGAKQPAKSFDRGYTPAFRTTKKRSSKAPWIAALAVAAAMLLVVGGLFLYEKLTDTGRILPNVYAGELYLGDMSQEAAETALASAAQGYAEKNLTVELPDCKLVLSPQETGAKLDTEKLVADAWDYGRTGSVFARLKARSSVKTQPHTLNLSDYLVLDTEYIQGALTQLSGDVASTLKETTVEVAGKDQKTGQTMTITMGTADRSVDMEDLYQKILKAYETDNFSPIQATYQEKLPEKLDLKKIFDQYCTAPVDATLDPETYDVTPEKEGYGFDLKKVQEQVDEAQEGQVLKIPFEVLTPKVTAESLEKDLFRDVLGQCSTDYSDIPSRTNNLILACEAIDGYIVKPGEIFSFNDVVGERTAEKGYQDALIYSGGLSVPALGGGVCQVASTIYCCTLYADLEIVERYCHEFVAYYVPHWGMDATVYWGALDFRFRNNTDYPIRIDADVSDGYVNVSLVGTDTKSYTVDIETEIVSSDPWQVKYQEIRKGDKDWGKYEDGETIVTPYTGYKIETYKIRTDKKTGQSTREWEAESIFERRDQLIAKVISDETKPTEPKPTDPPETTAPAETTAPTETEAPPETEPETSGETEEP